MFHLVHCGHFSQGSIMYGEGIITLHDEPWSLYTSLNAPSCNLFILLLSIRIWNMNAFIKSRNSSWFIYLETLASACSFKLTFWLSILIPKSLTNFSETIIFPPMSIYRSLSLLEIRSLHLSAFIIKRFVLNHSINISESNYRATTNSS